jgi:hypothetical protein
LQYLCGDKSSYEKSGGAFLQATVKAFLQMKKNASSGVVGEDGSSTLRYEAIATLNLANRTVTHLVESSNDPDYVVGRCELNAGDP